MIDEIGTSWTEASFILFTFEALCLTSEVAVWGEGGGSPFQSHMMSRGRDTRVVYFVASPILL